MPGLTKKQEMFAVAVAKGSNGADAYRGAYDTKGMTAKTIHEAASRLLRNSKVAARIEALRKPALRKAELSVERTLEEVAGLSYSDIGHMLESNGRLIPLAEMDPKVRRAISSIEFVTDKDGATTTKLKLWDKNSGLEKAMKHLGLFEKDNAQTRESLVLNVEPAKPTRR